MGVEQRAAEEADHQARRGGADGRPDGVPSRGFADGRPSSLLLTDRRRRRGDGFHRLGFGDAVGVVVGGLVGPILLGAIVVGHGTSLVIGT